MSRARLLRDAARICFLGTEAFGVAVGLPRFMAAAPSALGASQASASLRQFSATPARGAEEQHAQQQQQHQEQGQGQGSRGGTSRHSGNSSRVHSSRGRQHLGEHATRRLYIPKQWEHQGWRDRNLPLIQEMLGHIEAGKAWEARQAFDAALAPLEAAVDQGVQPPASQVPPPYAWKLYLAVLSATKCHAHRMSEVLGIMNALGVPPQAACYVIALRQMAMQGIGHPAYTTIAQMKDLGVAPTLRCYMFAIEANLKAQAPEFNFAKKLFDEVAEQGLAVRPTQKTEMGKLMMQGVREFARNHRFKHASSLLDQLEGMGLRVPAFLLAEVLQLAVQEGNEEAMHAIVERLLAATSTFQEIPGEREPVTRPLKVEEGLLLPVLEAAANRGNVPLAEAAWKLLERSLALPNPPSTAGGLKFHIGKAAQLEQLEEAAALELGGEEGQGVGQGAGAGAGEQETPGFQAAAAGEAAAADMAAAPATLDQLSAELEALDAAEAEATAARRAKQCGSGRQGDSSGGDGSPTPLPASEWNELAREEARAMMAQPRGIRPPSLLSHLAMVHAYARAGAAEAMFEAVRRVEEAFPQDPDAAAYHAALPMCVDSLAESVHACDDAFFLLERWAQEGRTVSAAQLNLVVAAYCQIGDFKRAFETFDAYEHLGVTPNADTYNALMQGCVECGQVETALTVFTEMERAGVLPNAFTHHQLVDACVVAGDVPSMMSGLEAMQEAGHQPKLGLLERCMARAERAGDREAVRVMLAHLLNNDYRIVGLEAKWRRWLPEGGMQMLTGSSRWFSREEIVRKLRKDHSISSRIARRSVAEQQQHREASVAGGSG